MNKKIDELNCRIYSSLKEAHLSQKTGRYELTEELLDSILRCCLELNKIISKEESGFDPTTGRPIRVRSKLERLINRGDL